jgi:hypothetical protein
MDEFASIVLSGEHIGKQIAHTCTQAFANCREQERRG